jgi:hypothetical protein
MGTFTNERQGHGASDAAAGPGDDGHSIFEQTHGILRRKGYLIRAWLV